MTQFNISLAPLLPWPLLIALAAGAVAIIALGLYTGRRGTWLRALGLALILFALADPSLVREDRKPLKDVVAVVIDESASQKIGPRAAQTRAAQAQIKAALDALGSVETRMVSAGGTTADNNGTQLFKALSGALSDVPPDRIGGAILVTDGLVHDIPANAAQLGFKAPLHALITGREGERDRRIELVEAPRFGLVGKDQTISVKVHDTAKSSEPIDLLIRRDGEQVGRYRARAGQTIKVSVRVEHGGPNVIELDVPVLKDELTALNNKAVVTIDGVRDKLKVLLVSGEPHAGERMWRNLLKSDANVNLIHFTILRPPEKRDGKPINELSLIAFPTAELFGSKIKDFDLIIFDRYSDQTILPTIYFRNIVNFVRNGGALMMAVGPDYATREGLFYSPLGEIAPARPTGQLIESAFRAAITEPGKKHPVSRGLPGSETNPPSWSEWYRQVGASTSRGVPVLAGAQNSPLLVLSREGKGRVGLMLSDQIWLWARSYQEGGPHLELLRRVAHWLMKEPELEEEALRAVARGTEISVTRQSLKEVVPPVILTSPTGKTQTITLTAGEPGLSKGSVKVTELGLFKLSDGTLNALVNVGPENPREFREVVSSLDMLGPLAKATGGTVRRIGQTSGAGIVMPRFAALRNSTVYGGSDYVGIKRTGASVITGIGVAPLAIGFLGLLALLGSIIGGWLWEGRQKRA
jgi:enamine deaminase RidA (YjgF/YER057c/UK114 family)